VCRPDSATYDVGTSSGVPPYDLPPSPKMEPRARKVLAEIAKLARTFWRKGSSFDVSLPTAPRHRSCVRLRLNPGSRSLRIELVRDCVAHPVKPGFFACSKS